MYMHQAETHMMGLNNVNNIKSCRTSSYSLYFPPTAGEQKGGLRSIIDRENRQEKKSSQGGNREEQMTSFTINWLCSITCCGHFTHQALKSAHMAYDMSSIIIYCNYHNIQPNISSTKNLHCNLWGLSGWAKMGRGGIRPCETLA